VLQDYEHKLKVCYLSVGGTDIDKLRMGYVKVHLISQIAIIMSVRGEGTMTLALSTHHLVCGEHPFLSHSLFLRQMVMKH